MRLLRAALPIALLALGLLVGSALAGDDEHPRGAADARVIWTFEKGGQAHDLDVTDMDPALREALEVQMRVSGWTRIEAPARRAEDAEKDIAELVRRRGRLPQGWRPAGLGPGPFVAGPAETKAGAVPPAPAVALARLVLRYLEVEQDPAQGPVQRARLRQMAERILRAPPPPPGAAPRMPTAPPAPRAPRPPRAGAIAGAPTKFGGAPIRYAAHASSRGVDLVTLGPVPEGSAAHAAGLRAGDRIVAIDGRPVDAAGLRKAVKAFTDGGQLTFEVVRRYDERETIRLLIEKE